jgi:hypothetical protein
MLCFTDIAGHGLSVVEGDDAILSSPRPTNQQFRTSGNWLNYLLYNNTPIKKTHKM